MVWIGGLGLQSRFPFIRGSQESKPPGPKPPIYHYVVDLKTAEVRFPWNQIQKQEGSRRCAHLNSSLLMTYNHLNMWYVWSKSWNTPGISQAKTSPYNQEYPENSSWRENQPFPSTWQTALPQWLRFNCSKSDWTSASCSCNNQNHTRVTWTSSRHEHVCRKSWRYIQMDYYYK